MEDIQGEPPHLQWGSWDSCGQAKSTGYGRHSVEPTLQTSTQLFIHENTAEKEKLARTPRRSNASWPLTHKPPHVPSLLSPSLVEWKGHMTLEKPIWWDGSRICSSPLIRKLLWKRVRLTNGAEASPATGNGERNRVSGSSWYSTIELTEKLPASFQDLL